MNAENHQSKWPIRFSALEPPTKLTTPISVLIIVIFIACIVIAILAIGWLLTDLLSGDQKRGSDAAKTALPILAGAVGLPLIVWRLLILDRQTRISDEKTQIDRETHYTSIFSRAIEQLGQTREIKRTVSSETGTLDTTTTVPNIEVRLGGIHSLSRLAEESARDRKTIANILRSYIRENSWSDRLGGSASKPDWAEESVLRWMYALRRNPSDAGAKSARQAWIERANKQTKNLSTWQGTLPETRVDVNEATDALVLERIDNDSTKPVLYECLFVGRRFGRSLLSVLDFRRCTFVKCAFDAAEQTFQIDDSFILDSQFNCAGSKISITDSRLSDTVFRAQNSTQLSMNWCDVHSVRIHGVPSQLDFESSTFYQLRLLGRLRPPIDQRTELHVADSALLESFFRGLKFSVASDLNWTGVHELEIEGCDLSEVVNFGTNSLNSTSANAETIHPASVARPSPWPALEQTRTSTGSSP
jgi:hypothetical protein